MSTLSSKILSTSIYGPSTNKGFGGLVSGLDTDDLVNQMTAKTRNKINKQYQAKQKLLYRQEAYREVSSKLLTFSDKYFTYSSGSKTNILSSNFFKSNTIESSSKYINVSGDADNIKNFSISDISSVATAASFVSDKKVSKQLFDTSEITLYTSSLAGATMSIEYGDTTYNLTIDKDFGKGAAEVTLKDVEKQLNAQIDKIEGLNGGTSDNTSDNKLIYSVSGDGKLVVNSTEGKTTRLSAASNEIITNLNMKVGETAESTTPITQISNLTKKASAILSNEEAYMTFDFNGVKKTINLKEGITDGAGLKEHLQSELNKAYGTNKVTVNLETVKDKNGEDTGLKRLTFKSDKNTDIFGVSSISKELSYFTGIESGTNNRVNRTSAIGDARLLVDALKTSKLTNGNDGYAIKINGELFEFEKTASFNDIMSKINSNADAGVSIYYSSTTDTFTAKSIATGSQTNLLIEEVGGGNLAEALFGKESVKDVNGNYIDGSGNYKINNGTDTTMTYTLNGNKGITVTRSTSTFTIDGMNIELNERAKDLDLTSNPVTFTVTNNSDEVVERVKQFINDYNEIITLIGTKTSEKPNREYQPLTPEQSDEMKEEEIEKWTAEAKKGILFGDINMNSVLHSLIETMSIKTSVSSLTLTDLGISSPSMDISGKLLFDEETFKTKLIQNPDEVAALFTQGTAEDGAVTGIAIQIQSILKDNIGTFGGSGKLISEAGMEKGLTANKNYLSERMKEYDKKMTELKKNLQVERARYWKKFTSLEKTLSSLNSQSAMFTNMMGS